jgi:GntR family transcriptional regulator
MSSALVKTPVYQQLNTLLRELLRHGAFRPGDQFLTERQICERYAVSRATANKALSNLVSEGMLEFRKGIGTFVRVGVLEYDTRSLVSFTEKAQAAGKQPSTRVRSLRRLAAAALPLEPARALGLESAEPLYFVDRIRLADGIPVILEQRYIVARWSPGLQESDLSGSLYALWSSRYMLEIAGADETIRAVALRGAEAAALAVRSGSAGFLVISTGYLAGGSPLWWEQTWYRGDMYEFHNRLGPISQPRPATGALRKTG